MNAGSIVGFDGKIIFVYGVAEYQGAFSSQKDYVGVDLATGKIDHVGTYSTSVSFDSLTKDQKLILSDHIKFYDILSKRVLAISGKARSGKDTLAKKVGESAYTNLVVALGDPIKEIARTLYGSYTGKNRDALIMIGQGLREKDPHIWVKTWLRKAISEIQTAIENDFLGVPSFTVSDVRQPNEFTFFKSLGATTVRIDSNEERRLELIEELDGSEGLDDKLLNDETELHINSFPAEFILFNEYDKTFDDEAKVIVKNLKDKGMIY